MIRQRLPESVIRSTFLLGFPETGKDRQELERFIQELELDWEAFYIFKGRRDKAYRFSTCF